MEFEPNCLGYALYSLGLRTKDRYKDPEKFNWENYFYKTDDVDEADAVIVTHMDESEGEVLVHIAILKPEDKGIVYHRRRYGTKISSDTLENLQTNFSSSIFNISFVKLIVED